MTMAALGDRLSTILEIDWRSRAEALLEERTRTKSGQVSVTHSFDIYKLSTEYFNQMTDIRYIN